MVFEWVPTFVADGCPGSLSWGAKEEFQHLPNGWRLFISGERLRGLTRWPTRPLYEHNPIWCGPAYWTLHKTRPKPTIQRHETDLKRKTMHLFYPNKWDSNWPSGLKTGRVVIIGGPKQQPDANPDFEIFFIFLTWRPNLMCLGARRFFFRLFFFLFRQTSALNVMHGLP